MRVLACNSPYGQGGTGQHFAQLVEQTRSEGLLKEYFCTGPKPGDDAGTKLPPPWWQNALLSYTPVRFSPAWKSYLVNEIYDRTVAQALSPPLNRYMGFAGKSLRTFERARRLGADRLELVSATSHVNNVKRLHDRAHRDFGRGTGWLHPYELKKTLNEYELADCIYVHSEYTRQSFLREGIEAGKLERTHLYVDPRFTPPTERHQDDVFRVIFVGRLDFTKGIPLLMEAFDALPKPSKELIIVGGWGTRPMRKYVQSWLSRSDQITITPGDPLPHLQRADVFVHPAYQDGFGYAPMEALACGVPTLVTEDTGMKEYVEDGVNGFVVPTGQLDTIIDRLVHVSDHPMASTRSLLPESAPQAVAS